MLSKHMKLNKKQERLIKIAEKCYNLTDSVLIAASNDFHKQFVLPDMRRQMENGKKVAV